MRNKEFRNMYVINEIIKNTNHWTVDMWYDFRNVFIPDYYEIKQTEVRSEFNEWKLDRIKFYNKLIEKI